MILLGLQMSKGQEKLSNAKKLWKEMRTFKWDFPDGVVQLTEDKPISGPHFFPAD